MIHDYIKLSSENINLETQHGIYKNYLTNKLKMKTKFIDFSQVGINQLNVSNQNNVLNENSGNVTSIEENTGSKNILNSLNLSTDLDKDSSFRTLERQRNMNGNFMRFVNIPKEDKKSESAVIEGELELGENNID